MDLETNQEIDVIVTSEVLEVTNCIGIQNLGNTPIKMSLQEFAEGNSGYTLEKHDVFTFDESKTLYLISPAQVVTIHLQGGE